MLRRETVSEAELSVAMKHVAAREMRAFRLAEMVDGTVNTNCRSGGRRSKTKWTVADYDACAAKGMSRQECAKILGVSDDAVDYMVRAYGVRFVDGRRRK